MYKEIKQCRICGNNDLVSVLNLGQQVLTGVFPRNKKQKITAGPLNLVKCQKGGNRSCCGLLQLRHSYSLDEMYGDSYGYRSGLNLSMVRHLRDKVNEIMNLVSLSRNDMVIDIGSNDSTLLQAYPDIGLIIIGIDPLGNKFRKYYPKHIQLIPDFFSAAKVKKNFGARKAKAITSIAMLYDLENPLDFIQDVYEILDDEGVWVFEQSYMPIMLESNSYDTICHEHLEYYGLRQIKWMMDKVGFKIIDVKFNKINGGSFSVTVAKKNSPYRENTALIEKILLDEDKRGLSTLAPYEDFGRKVYNHRQQLRQFINNIKYDNKKIIGYGASTKGNVVLQFCGFTAQDIPFIAEVNEDKFGRYTPGTHIPIVSEQEAKRMNPDYLLILPWHFKDSFLEKEKDYLERGGKLLIPLPEIEIITGRAVSKVL